MRVRLRLGLVSRPWRLKKIGFKDLGCISHCFDSIESPERRLLSIFRIMGKVRGSSVRRLRDARPVAARGSNGNSSFPSPEAGCR